MRLPYIQVAEWSRARARDMAHLLGAHRQLVCGQLEDLTEWMLSRVLPDGVFNPVIGPRAGKLIEGAVEWTGTEGAWIEAAVEVGVLLRVCGGYDFAPVFSEPYVGVLRRRQAAAARQRKAREQHKAVTPASRVTVAKVGAKTETETETETERQQPPPSVETAAFAPSAFALSPTKPEKPPRRRSLAEAFFDRCEDARGASGVGGSRRHLQGKQIARWNAFYREKLVALGGDEERLMRVVASYLRDKWALSLSPPCPWSGLTSADAWERCLAASELARNTGPPSLPGPRNEAERLWFTLLEAIPEYGRQQAMRLRPNVRLVDGGALSIGCPDIYGLPWWREHYGQHLNAAAQEHGLTLIFEEHAEAA